MLGSRSKGADILVVGSYSTEGNDLMVLEFLALVKNEVTALYPETVISHSPAIRGLDKKLTYFILLATRAWRLIAKLEKTLRFARPEKIK